MNSESERIGYIVKRYPRFSETFIVNEILAHEATGLDLEIFSLGPSCETHFQSNLSLVRAPVHYLPSKSLKAIDLWNAIKHAGRQFPDLWPALERTPADVSEVFQAIELARQCRNRRIGHLHAHFATSAASVAQLTSKIAGIGYSITMHAKDIFHETVCRENLKDKIDSSRFVVTVSDFNRNYLKSLAADPSKVHRVYNGLNLEMFPYSAPRERRRKIIAVGRLVAKKGFADLISACYLLSQRGVEYHCEIVGGGELQSELQQQIDLLGVAEQVRLMGCQPQFVVKQMIQSAAVLAAPCVVSQDGNRDGLPTVLIEAMALGTPCISTAVTGIPEIVRHDQTGWIVPENSPSELAGSLSKMVDDSALRLRLAENGRRLVEQQFDIDRNSAQIRALFLAPADHNVPCSRLQAV